MPPQQVEVAVGSADGATLVASVRPAQVAMLGPEGFRIARVDGVVGVEATSSSALLYGIFRLLATMQQHNALPTNYTSTPAMERRVWCLHLCLIIFTFAYIGISLEHKQ